MDFNILAIAEINFPGQLLQDSAAQAVETTLRKNEESISNLSLQGDKIAFFIWGINTIDYHILDELKDILPADKKFVISAREYKDTGKRYSYNSGSF